MTKLTVTRLAACLVTLLIATGSVALGAGNAASYWSQQVGIQPDAANPGTSFAGTLKDPGKLKGMAVPGSNAVAGHGSSDMPVWGSVFKSNVRVKAKFNGKGIWTITDVKARKDVKVKLKVPGVK